MSIMQLLESLSASNLGLIVIGVILAIVFMQRVSQYVEEVIKRKAFNGTPKDRRNGETGSVAVGLPNPYNNGGLQREIGAMAANIDALVTSLKDHHDKDMIVAYDTLRAVEKTNEDEEGRHRRIRKSIDEQTGIIAENTLTVQTMSAKVDKL